ncbi:MAG: alpha/beta hydrolase [Pseudomonadota bacterium]
MNTKRVSTALGTVSVRFETGGAGVPLVFLHGVFLDNTLWEAFDSSLTGRTHLYVDMPAHGESDNVGRDWTLDECVGVLLAVLDAFQVPRCIAIGHSWGSMTALRAASTHPERFAALGLFNMPFTETRGLARLGFHLQKQLTGFKSFYARQAAKAMYSPRALADNPAFRKAMQARLRSRPSIEIARVIDAVILGADAAHTLITTLYVPAHAVVGESDYVGSPPGIVTRTVPGGHISPHEAPSETAEAIVRTLTLASAR